MRLIDADALKEHLDYVCVGGGKWGDAEKAFINAFKDFVDGEITIQLELPSAQQWVPCSERLPSRGVPVLVSGIMEDAPPITISTDAPHYYKEGWINAWMPLPKPYEGRTE